jgi:DNA-directed RNA polymerase specialized sigma24 family protein
MSKQDPGNLPDDNDNHRIRRKLNQYRAMIGDSPSAWNELWTMIQPIALRIATKCHMSAGLNDLHEMEQDANTKAEWLVDALLGRRKWTDSGETSNYTGWLKTTLMNKVRDRLRRKERRIVMVASHSREVRPMVELEADTKTYWREDVAYVAEHTDDLDEAEKASELAEPLKLFPVTDDDRRAHALVFPKPSDEERIAESLGIDRRELDRRVEACWDRLIFLRIYCGREKTEIAREWGVSNDLIEPRLQRVRRILARAYGYER